MKEILKNKELLTPDAVYFVSQYPEVINMIAKRFEEEVSDNIQDYPDLLEENIRDETANVIKDVLGDADLQI